MEIKFYFKKMASKIGIFSGGKFIKLYSDIAILLASSYLMAKKLFGVSVTGWLLNNAFQMPLVKAFTTFSGVVIFSAIAFKITSIVFENFVIKKHSHAEPREISSCLHSMNLEIMSHLKKRAQNERENIKSLKSQHAFDVNVRMIIDALAENIRKSIDGIKIKRKDVFISLYSYDEIKKHLSYELHHDATRDIVKSKTIKPSDKNYKNYECVKCLSSSNTTAYILNSSQYAKGASNRHKTVRHYMGCKLETNGDVFGFLNIEFHNNSVFLTEDSMQDFYGGKCLPIQASP